MPVYILQCCPSTDSGYSVGSFSEAEYLCIVWSILEADREIPCLS